MNTSYHDFYSAYRSQGLDHNKASSRAELTVHERERSRTYPEPWVSLGYGNTATVDEWKRLGRKDAK